MATGKADAIAAWPACGPGPAEALHVRRTRHMGVSCYPVSAEKDTTTAACD